MIQVNALLMMFVLVYVAKTLLACWIERLNLLHLKRHGHVVPKSLEGFVDVSKLVQITAYTRAKSRLHLVRELVSDGLLLLIILSGILPMLHETLSGHRIPYLLAGLIFFLLPTMALSLTDLPFDYYHAFVIEERFGFNRSTLKLWIMDHLKAALISFILLAVLLSLVLWMINLAPSSWWLWSFVIISGFQIGIAVLYPVLIAPLFNRFDPIQDEPLARSIKALMEANGIRVKNIFQMNAGLRSRHTNAYFTGLGKTKQIVLYDTLLESHSHEEILAILAHEVGHFKGRHILKQLLILEAAVLVILYLTHSLLSRQELYQTFGFQSTSAYVGLFLIGIFWQRAGFFLQPMLMAVSRRFEREADTFAVKLVKAAAPLAESLKRLVADNLSNLNPHPLYVRFHYSHPPVLERIRFLEALGAGRQGGR